MNTTFKIRVDRYIIEKLIKKNGGEIYRPVNRYWSVMFGMLPSGKKSGTPKVVNKIHVVSEIHASSIGATFGLVDVHIGSPRHEWGCDISTPSYVIVIKDVLEVDK